MAKRRRVERTAPKLPPELWIETWCHLDEADRWSARQVFRLFNAIDFRQTSLSLWKAWEVAAFEGSMQLLKKMVEYGADDWNEALKEACQGGHLAVA